MITYEEIRRSLAKKYGEDIAQEVCLRTHKLGLRERADGITYFHRVAQNVKREWARKAVREVALEAAKPSKDLPNQLDSIELDEVWEKLPDHLKAIFILGLGPAAERLGMSTITLRGQLHRWRKEQACDTP